MTFCRDPSSEEMSDDEDGDKDEIVPPEESVKAKEDEGGSLDVSNVDVPTNLSEGQSHDSVSENHEIKKEESDSVPQILDNVLQNMDSYVQQNFEFEDKENTGVDIVESFLKEVENTLEPVDCNTNVTKEDNYVINTNNEELGKDVESDNVIHKKKNKKRRKHAKKKKTGDKTVEGDEDVEEEDAVDEQM